MILAIRLREVHPSHALLTEAALYYLKSFTTLLAPIIKHILGFPNTSGLARPPSDRVVGFVLEISSTPASSQSLSQGQ